MANISLESVVSEKKHSFSVRLPEDVFDRLRTIEYQRRLSSLNKTIIALIDETGVVVGSKKR